MKDETTAPESPVCNLDPVLGIWKGEDRKEHTFLPDSYRPQGLEVVSTDTLRWVDGRTARRLVGLMTVQAESSHFSPDEDWLWVSQGEDSWVLDGAYQTVLAFKGSKGRLCRGGRVTVSKEGLTDLWDLRSRTKVAGAIPGLPLRVGAERLLYQGKSSFVVRHLETAQEVSLGQAASIVTGEPVRTAVLQGNGWLRAVDLETRRFLWQRRGEGLLRMKPDETQLAVHHSGKVLVLDSRDGTQVASLDFPGSLLELKWAGPTLLVTREEEGDMAGATWWHQDKWDQPTGMRQFKYGRTMLKPYCETDRDGRRLMLLQGEGAGDDYQLKGELWFREGSRAAGFRQNHVSNGNFGHLSPDGEWMAINYRCGGSFGQKMCLVHCSGSKEIYLPYTLPGFLFPSKFNFDAEGRRLKIHEGSGLSIWDLANLRSQAPPVPSFADGPKLQISVTFS